MRYGLAMLGVVAVGLLGACCREKTDVGSLREWDRQMYAAYLNGNLDAARDALYKEINAFENARSVDQMSFIATALSLQAARLYVLEDACGNRDAAELAWARVRYWNMRRFELGGATPDAVRSKLEPFTPEKVVSIVDAIDRDHRAGALPEYRSHLSAGQKNP